ncbi:MAG TPA: hypothetical protein PLO93_00980 [Candidatus Omnitrophota bacterium]|nr:hypothetical protein [Candidatus Omnitrophota bacterium]HQL40852.1 hypothetical protein [Candidatus Omnitrophota bacterium]
MNKLIMIMMYALWTLTLIGILVVTFTSFQYPDLNIVVLLLAVFALINTYFSLKHK